MYKKWLFCHFYIHTDKETEFSNMHFNCTKNTIMEARLQESRRNLSGDFVLRRILKTDPLVTLSHTENTDRAKLVIVRNYFY